MKTRGSIKVGFIALIVGGIALIAAASAGVHYTSQPAFCASCHEMQSLHRGWSKGSHANTGCSACHADNTIAGQVRAKVNGLRQVYTHFTTQVDLGRVNAPVPARRCVRCHDLGSEEKLGARVVIAHRKHIEAKLDCMECHFTTGHTREVFTGFKPAACRECHSAAPGNSLDAYLRKVPCTRK